MEKRRTSGFSFLVSDLSDVPENLPLPAPGSESPQALNYSQIASAAVAVSQGGQDPSVSSTETLLRNIQGLLKVAVDNARQQERQINYEKGQCRIPSRGRSSYYILSLSRACIKGHLLIDPPSPLLRSTYSILSLARNADPSTINLSWIILLFADPLRVEKNGNLGARISFSSYELLSLLSLSLGLRNLGGRSSRVRRPVNVHLRFNKRRKSSARSQ